MKIEVDSKSGKPFNPEEVVIGQTPFFIVCPFCEEVFNDRYAFAIVDKGISSICCWACWDGYIADIEKENIEYSFFVIRAGSLYVRDYWNNDN